jgi:hypothetical protein
MAYENVCGQQGRETEAEHASLCLGALQSLVCAVKRTEK